MSETRTTGLIHKLLGMVSLGLFFLLVYGDLHPSYEVSYQVLFLVLVVAGLAGGINTLRETEFQIGQDISTPDSAVERAHQRYVDGEIDELELEQELEDALK